MFSQLSLFYDGIFLIPLHKNLFFSFLCHFFVYVIYSDLIQFLFGNGIGMSNSVIATFTDIFIYTKSEFDFINSRWLFYTLLIDFGLIGLIYFTYLIIKHIPRDKSFLTLS